MIGYLKGKILYLKPNETCLEINGVGYRVSVPQRLLANLELRAEISFWIQEINREDSRELYGFSSLEERELFNQLLGVSHVGPKVALSFLTFPPTELALAIMKEDAEKLAKLPGIGKKTAQRVSLELKDKILKMFPAPLQKEELTRGEEVLDFLVSLGATTREAQAALDAARKITPQGYFEELLTESLKILGEKK